MAQAQFFVSRKHFVSKFVSFHSYLNILVAETYFSQFSTQSQEITQSGNFHAAIVYVIETYFFSQRQASQSESKRDLLPISAVNYSRHLKLRNIIALLKISTIQENFYSLLIRCRFFKSKFSCTQLILANRKYLL